MSSEKTPGNSPYNIFGHPSTFGDTSAMEFVEGIVPLLLVLLLGIAGAAMKLYRDRQEPFDSAKPALVSDETMSVVKLPGGHILFVPATRVSDTHGVAYLPGALVNHLAYAPLCREIARLSKLPVLLLSVTFRLAILGKVR